MSCYEWERGEFKIPSAEWAKLKKKMRDAFNAKQDELFIKATTYYKLLMEFAKGRRKISNEEWEAEFKRIRSYNMPESDEEKIRDALNFPYRYCGEKPKRPNRPKKKDFPKATNKTNQYNFGESSLYFYDKTRTVVWDVPENNHACDRSEEEPLASDFFNFLKEVKWTRNTGGVIVGNDEYNRDNTYDGGGANYIKGGYGPLGVKAVGRSMSF